MGRLIFDIKRYGEKIIRKIIMVVWSTFPWRVKWLIYLSIASEQEKDIKEFNKRADDDCFYLLIGDLKKAIKDKPNDGIVFYQRIEDKYFWDNNWSVKKKRIGTPDESQYISAFCVITYKDDPDNLYIDAHY
jgi:hypothetical protein